MELNLRTKAVLITGSSRGIGRSIALCLAAEGCRLALCARGRDDLASVIREIHEMGGEACALELGPLKIRINSVSPGSVLVAGGAWESFRENEPERFAAFVRDEFPFQRLGRPEEIAEVVAFLLSERASWINGADIPVDGAQGRSSVL